MTDRAGLEPDTATKASPLSGGVFIGMWRTGPPNALIAFEVWGRRADRVAVVRAISAPDSETPQPMDAGTASAGGTDDCRVVWTTKAHRTFGEGLLDRAEAEAKRLLANRWRASLAPSPKADPPPGPPLRWGRRPAHRPRALRLPMGDRPDHAGQFPGRRVCTGAAARTQYFPRGLPRYSPEGRGAPVRH